MALGWIVSGYLYLFLINMEKLIAKVSQRLMNKKINQKKYLEALNFSFKLHSKQVLIFIQLFHPTDPHYI